MLKITSTVLLLLCLGVGATAANPDCLRPAEAEAEQAIRFQTELMVVSETCHEQAYPQFLHRNRRALADYQRRMLERYRRAGAPRPKASLDSYMTRLANETALRVSDEPAEVLCHEQADFLAAAKTLDGKKFRRYITKQAVERDGEHRRCTE
jgi:hypothetical protein